MDLFIKVLFDKLIHLNNQIENIGVIMSDNKVCLGRRIKKHFL